MSLSVAGKHAVITGAASGINLAFARLLLAQGCSVLLADLQLRPESQALLDAHPHPSSSSSSKPSALFHKTDVTSWPQLSALWSHALQVFPAVDIVVPGAGIFEPRWSSFWEPPGSSESRDPADAEPGHYAVLDVNLTHPIRLSQLAIGHWTRHGQEGCIVHVGSMAGYMAAINTPLYFASKHGLHGFVRSLGGLRDQVGIRVGCVAPGSVKVSMPVLLLISTSFRTDPSQTPMWFEDPTKAMLLSDQSPFVEAEDIADAMYDLVVREDLGNGTIYECGKGGKRVVPEFHTEPPSADNFMPGYIEESDKVFESLRKDGMKK